MATEAFVIHPSYFFVFLILSSIWNDSRRYRMRRDRFLIEILGDNKPEALDLLRAYDRGLIRFLEKSHERPK